MTRLVLAPVAKDVCFLGSGWLVLLIDFIEQCNGTALAFRSPFAVRVERVISTLDGTRAGQGGDKGKRESR